MALAVLAVLAAAALAAAPAGCDRDATGGLPPASEWKPPAPKPSKVEGGGRAKSRSPRGSASHRLEPEAADPHAGLDMEEGEQGEEDEGDGAAEAAEEDEAEDPHGPDPNHGEEAADEEPEERGPLAVLAAGTIRAEGEAASAVKPGTVIYLSAVPIDGTGKQTGPAVAVDRFEVKSLPVPFELSGSPFKGDVVITAWTDRDGEARTREPGDAEGRVRARLPAESVELVLDKLLR